VFATLGWENLTKDHLEDIGIDGSIILECVLKKRFGGRGLD